MNLYLLLLVLPAVVTPTLGVELCKICKCSDTEIDCINQKIASLTDLTDWPDKNITYERISFDNNFIGNLTAFPAISTKILSINNNGMVYVSDDCFHNVSNLEQLDLSSNQLTKETLLPHVFRSDYKVSSPSYDPIDTLTVLKLNRNRFNSLKHDLFMHLPNIEVLDLSDNNFTTFDTSLLGAIRDLVKLKSLDLSYSRITSLPQYLLHDAAELKVLNISGNALTEIPANTLAECRGLEVLVLNDNPIHTITTGLPFPQMKALTELHISHMPELTRIENGTFKNLFALKHLDCQMNKNLSIISPAALYHKENTEAIWPIIEKLYINDNALVYLDNSFLARWDLVKDINIRGNHWSCDCLNQFLVSTLTNLMNNIDPGLIDGVQCASPIEMRGKSFKYLNEKKYEMRCLDMYGAHPENDTKMLVGVFVGVLVAIPMLVFVYLMWKRSSIFKCREGGPVNYTKAFYQRQISDDDEVI